MIPVQDRPLRLEAAPTTRSCLRRLFQLPEGEFASS